ncbi:MAG: GntR family transcriptional regulator [Balneolaceae bacterium]|nr:GntR family transcriptional regulator [Balneolaceae bacterium]MBO6547306.1 GntR family transcriptional regulator [Balneolaceae bacterium]MBO6647747.1 GntR family transcriptional regulator [Balneolaceae bacterium]
MAIDFQDSTPLYIQIIKDIKKKIDNSELVLGQQLKSHKELAQEYDVSLITIKSALSSLIDEGYLFSRVGKGTFVAKRQTSENVTTQDSIGLVLKDLKNPFFSLITQTIEETAYTEKYNVLLSNSSRQIKKEDAQIKNFKKLGVKGLILASLNKEPHAPELVRQLQKENYPYVMVSYVADEDIYYVGADHEYGGYLAAKHLISLGHTEIGYINSPKNNLLGDVRLQGLKKGLEEANLTFKNDYLLRLGSDTYPGGFEAGYKLGDLFDQMPDKPTAFFTYNDLSAIGFIRRILELGYRVPEDLSIIGFDDIEQAEYSSVPLSTVHQPIEGIGASAINKLIDLIEGRKPEYRTILKPKLVIRESCGAKLQEHVPVRSTEIL